MSLSLRYDVRLWRPEPRIEPDPGLRIVLGEVVEAEQRVAERWVNRPQQPGGEPRRTCSGRDRDRVLLQPAQVAREGAIHSRDPVQYRLGIMVVGARAPRDHDRFH